LARAQDPTGVRISLRATPGGFGTVELGPRGDGRAERLRVGAGHLLAESAGADGTSGRALALDGASLDELAAFAGVDLGADFTVGPATPPLGDISAPIRLHGASAALLGDAYDVGARALDQVVAAAPAWASPSVAQVWPEHFDLAIDLAFDSGAPAARRVNLGESPGDSYHAGPYLYVGPWTPERPGDESFWNASFGALLGFEDLADADAVSAAVRFFRRGLDLLAA
jgi:hypothetical protein